MKSIFELLLAKMILDRSHHKATRVILTSTPKLTPNQYRKMKATKFKG